MDVKNSKRLLVVGAPGCGALDILKQLTGSAPSPDESGSTAGLTHEWDVKTAYYSAKVPIWVDEISDLEAWETDFLKPEAKEVVDAVGAWIYCFNLPENGGVSSEVEASMKAIQDIVEKHVGYGADTVMLAVAMPSSTASPADGAREGWEDTCLQYDFEYIDYAAKGTNEFGERVGCERLKEALEANEWAAESSSDVDALEAFDIEEDDGIDNFGHEEAEMTAELFGMKAALLGDDWEPAADDVIPPQEQGAQVDDLERMMGKLLAIKEQGEDLPEAQRKRMAARAVRELMNDGESG